MRSVTRLFLALTIVLLIVPSARVQRSGSLHTGQPLKGVATVHSIPSATLRSVSL